MATGERAVLLVDHGSRRPQANAQLEDLADRIRALRPDWAVYTAHLEISSPGVAEALDSCAAACASAARATRARCGGCVLES